MEKNKSLRGKELDIYFLNYDSRVKVGNLILKDQVLSTEADCIDFLQKTIKNPTKGNYSVNLDKNLFASFQIETNKIMNLNRRSISTGAILPCWNHFDAS
jgi:hypothetical protein